VIPAFRGGIGAFFLRVFGEKKDIASDRSNLNK